MLGFCMCTHKPSGTLDVNKALDYCAEQTQRTLAELKTDSGIDYTMMPRNIMTDEHHWNCRKATKEEWCAGFWPGVLWYDYEYSGDKRIKEEAEKFTASLEFLSKTPAFDHDLGFLIFCSYGNGYRLTQNPAYKQVILDTADTLATLFKPQVGTMLSWPRNVELFGGHNTIMDNMINLEMLFWAAKNGYERIVTSVDNLKFLLEKAADAEMSEEEKPLVTEAQGFETKFDEAMDDDFNTADALAAIFELVKFVNSNAKADSSKAFLEALKQEIVTLSDICGLIVDKKAEMLDSDIEALIEERQAARKAKNFARADEIRDELLAKGIVLEDTREGVKWKRA